MNHPVWRTLDFAGGTTLHINWFGVAVIAILLAVIIGIAVRR